MESVRKIAIFGLEIMVKSGIKKNYFEILRASPELLLARKFGLARPVRSTTSQTCGTTE